MEVRKLCISLHQQTNTKTTKMTTKAQQINEINARVNASKAARNHESNIDSVNYEKARQMMMFYADNCGIDLTLEKALEMINA